ncbi:hypothetical protein DEU40_10923 [Chryseobacterium sp. AG844]|nr:hypothetical protein DEU40_10923 [Chryseobacterium sp. AG844]
MNYTNFHKSIIEYEMNNRKKLYRNVQLFYVYVKLTFTTLLPE